MSCKVYKGNNCGTERCSSLQHIFCSSRRKSSSQFGVLITTHLYSMVRYERDITGSCDVLITHESHVINHDVTFSLGFSKVDLSIRFLSSSSITSSCLSVSSSWYLAKPFLILSVERLFIKSSCARVFGCVFTVT